MREDRPSSTATLIAAATVFLARDARAFGCIIAERAPAETAAHVALVQRHLAGREAERLRHGVQRFHLGVIAVVAEILRLVGLRRRAESALGVALRIERLGFRLWIRMNLGIRGLQLRF